MLEYVETAIPSDLHGVVMAAMTDKTFVENYSMVKKSAPLAMVAVARHVTVDLVQPWFPLYTMALTVPVHRVDGVQLDPHYHSIEGQQLLLVQWETQFPGLSIQCPCNDCNGTLKKDRTNFSKK